VVDQNMKGTGLSAYPYLQESQEKLTAPATRAKNRRLCTARLRGNNIIRDFIVMQLRPVLRGGGNPRLLALPDFAGVEKDVKMLPAAG
jgi:hypothetical protein